ncbi:MAG: lysostaphin resistance A-like protein [Paracoccaceae bacterium]
MRHQNPYAAQIAQLQALKFRCEVWRLIVGFVVILLITVVLSFGISGFCVWLMPEGWIIDLARGNTSSTLLVLLFSFISVIIGVQVTVRVVQKRSLRSVLGSVPLAVQQFTRVMTFLAGLMLLLLVLPPYGLEEPLEVNLSLGRWVMLLPFAIAALLVQTSSEEVLFRGFLQQSLAARFRAPWVFILIPSAIFALGHYAPEQSGGNAWIIVAWAGLFGVLMADLTARAGTLGPAIAVHFFNNFTAIVLVAPASTMNGLALYRFPFELSDTAASRPWLAVDFVMLIVCWLIGRLAIRR